MLDARIKQWKNLYQSLIKLTSNHVLTKKIVYGLKFNLDIVPYCETEMVF
jgi:hypothetical protein